MVVVGLERLSEKKMWIIRRYIFVHIFLALLLIAIAVLGLQTIFGLAGELGDIGVGNYDTVKAFLFVLMQLPNFLFIILPLVVLIGTIVGLYILCASKEMLIIRSAGVSIKSIVQAVLFCAVFLMLFAFLLGGFIVPKTNYQSNILKNTAKGNQVLNLGEQSTWFKQDNRFVLIDNIKSPSRINQIKQYEVDNDHIKDISHAQYATYNTNYQSWDLHQIKAYEINDNKILASEIKFVPNVQLMNPAMLKVINRQADETSFIALWHFMSNRNTSQSNIVQYRSNFYRILTMPISCLLMMLIAIPFTINGSNAYKHFGKNIFIGFTIGLSYFLVDRLAVNYALIYHQNMLLISFCPAILYFLLTLILMRTIQ